MTRRLIPGVALAVGLIAATGCPDKKKPSVNVDAIPTVPADPTPPPASAPTEAVLGAAGGSPTPSGGMPSRGNTNFQSGAGAVQNVRNAARRSATLNDMHQLGTFMTQMELENGKMPQPAEVKAYIQRDAPKIVTLIDDGSIILTGTRDRGGLWAYEVDAETRGGVGLVGGTPRRLDAFETKQLLGK